MNPVTPPPFPSSGRGSLSRRDKLLIGLGLIPACLVGGLIALRLIGVVRPFSVPTGAMTPAVSAGDHVVMEGFTFLARKPRRGDIVVFRTDGIPSVPSGTFYVKRVAGEPGEHVRLSDGKLFVNGKQVVLSNALGEIVYDWPPGPAGSSPTTDFTVPEDGYFVLGDNSTDSLDSRFFGSVPRQNVIGRIWFCYWPLLRIGGVK